MDSWHSKSSTIETRIIFVSHLDCLQALKFMDNCLFTLYSTGSHGLQGCHLWKRQ